MIELRDISKRFGDTVALAGVSLEVGQAERLALVGENGAGKSSLMNVLYGLYQPDSGEVRFDGQATRLKTPADALARGVGMVHQHFTLVPTLSVTENVVLGLEPRKGLFFDLDRARADVARTCQRLGFELDLEARVDGLSVGSQQKAEIVKALHRGATTLILDEPTAVLTPQEAEELFQVTRALSDEGITVVLISHKLKEVLAFATRIVVMRRGRKVAEVRPGETTAGELAGLMVGDGGRGAVSSAPPRGAELSGSRERMVPSAPPGGAEPSGSRAQAVSAPGTPRDSGGSAPGDARGPRVFAAQAGVLRDDGGTSGEPGLVAVAPGVWPSGPPALELQHLDAAGLHDVSLEVRAGEILGVAGVDGNGQRELAEVVTGLRLFTHGRLLLGGVALETLTPHEARSRGVAHIPEDRLARALISELTVEENVALGRQRSPPFARGSRIDVAGRRARTTALLSAHDVRPPDAVLRAGALSGGNQQKLVVARELDGRPKLLVVVQPTRGLDVAAVEAVRARLLAERRRGCGVLLISLDLDEVMALADRLVVLFGGRVQTALRRDEFDERAIGRHMLGVAHA